MSIAAAVLMTLGLAQSPPAVVEDPWDWAVAVEPAVWTTLLSQVPELAEPDGREVQWSVAVSGHDGWGRTAQVRLSRTDDSRLRAAWVLTAGDNLLGQLHALREADPKLTAADALGRLSIQRGAADATSCPSIDRLAGEFQKLTIRALPEDYLALHSPSFEVTVSPSFRDATTYHVDKNENALAIWCARLVEALRRCHSRPTNP
jgi:hypothetical protein